jgi:FG-GAP repeat
MKIHWLFVGIVFCAGVVFSVSEDAKLTASDGARDDVFGSSVAIDGDTAVVGAPWKTNEGLPDGRYAGAAYVFVRDSSGTWTEQQKLLPGTPGIGAFFGTSVAIEGDTAVIGARRDNYTGSAYVFTRTGTVWTQQARLTASDAADDDQFGFSVSVSGETVVVGAYKKNTTAGAAYVFKRSGASWAQEAKLLGLDTVSGDEFGYSVSVDDDTALIGAPSDIYYPFDAGAAYVFTRDEFDVWHQRDKLLASDRAVDDRFGHRLSLDGDLAVVSSYLDDAWAGADQGSAYIFTRVSLSDWTQTAKLTAADAAAGDHFGSSVSIDGINVAIGASYDGDLGLYSGSAYLFSQDGAGDWSQETKFNASDGSSQDLLGCAVSIDDRTVIAGAYFDSDISWQSGSAYVFSFCG